MFTTAVLARPNHLLALIAALSPNQAVVIATLGLCLIFLELNRPGRILPGALGLTLVLLATATLLHYPLHPAALVWLGLASATLAAQLWRQVPLWVAGATTVVIAFSLRFLIPESTHLHINTPTALTCGAAIGLLGTALSRIALRARRLKAVH